MMDVSLMFFESEMMACMDREEETDTSCEEGDYSPSDPWNAPGMSIRDFM